MLLDGLKNGFKSVRLLSDSGLVCIPVIAHLPTQRLNAPIVELLRPGEYQIHVLRLLPLTAVLPLFCGNVFWIYGHS